MYNLEYKYMRMFIPLATSYDLFFTEKEVNEIIKKYDSFYYCFVDSINEFGRLIRNFALLGYTDEYDESRWWDVTGSYNWFEVNGELVQESTAHACNRIYIQYVGILKEYNKRYPLFKRLLYKLLLKLKNLILGENLRFSFYDKKIGRYLLKVPFISNLLHKYDDINVIKRED